MADLTDLRIRLQTAFYAVEQARAIGLDMSMSEGLPPRFARKLVAVAYLLDDLLDDAQVAENLDIVRHCKT